MELDYFHLVAFCPELHFDGSGQVCREVSQPGVKVVSGPKGAFINVALPKLNCSTRWSYLTSEIEAAEIQSWTLPYGHLSNHSGYSYIHLNVLEAEVDTAAPAEGNPPCRIQPAVVNNPSQGKENLDLWPILWAPLSMTWQVRVRCFCSVYM